MPFQQVKAMQYVVSYLQLVQLYLAKDRVFNHRLLWLKMLLENVKWDFWKIGTFDWLHFEISWGQHGFLYGIGIESN
jgi:hypothetical protein